MNSKYWVVLLGVVMIGCMAYYFYEKELRCRAVSREVFKQCSVDHKTCYRKTVAAYFKCR